MFLNNSRHTASTFHVVNMNNLSTIIIIVNFFNCIKCILLKYFNAEKSARKHYEFEFKIIIRRFRLE